MRAAGAAILALTLSATVGPAEAQTPDAEKAALIGELMQVTQARPEAASVAQAMLQHLTAALQRRDPNLPPAVLEIVREETLATFTAEQGALVEGVSGVYGRHFTEAELREIVAFYRTPIGRKLAQTMPTVAQESALLGQDWAQRVTPALVGRIKMRAEKEAGYRIE